jgi:hypothetical protein
MTRKYLAILLLMPVIGLTQIAPVVAAGLIAAGASLVSGLFGNAAASEREKKRALQEGLNQSFAAQQQGAKAMGDNAQTGFNQLMSAYEKSFL